MLSKQHIDVPRSEDTERAILGSCVLDNSVIAEVVDSLNVDCFYNSTHKDIFEAIRKLYSENKAVDLVSIVASISKGGDQVNYSTIASIISGSIKTKNVAQYIQILLEKYKLRELIKLSSSILSLATSGDESSQVFEKIEETSRKIAVEYSCDLLSSKELFADYDKYIESILNGTYRHNSIKTGLRDLDFLTNGYEPGTLNIIAARPSQGKTALALDVIRHNLKCGKSIAFFSLEMSLSDIRDRIIAAEACINFNDVKAGAGFLESDVEKIADALDKIVGGSLYINKISDLSVSNIRSMCRKIKSKINQLDLIVIDYLQLISYTGRSESRNREVTEISRSLKMMAMQLGCPVIALSQLNRSGESRVNKRPVLSDLRESGCISGDSLVTLADGTEVSIESLDGMSDFMVQSLNLETMQIESAMASKAFCSGEKQVHILKTKTGMEIKATANHKFLTPDGWKRLDELKLGELVATPRTLKVGATQTIPDNELALMGHLIGDGCTLPRHAIQYTTGKVDLADLVAELARDIFGKDVEPRISKERTWYQVYLASTRKHSRYVHSAVSDWLNKYGIFGLRSYEKKIPSEIFKQPKKAIAVFLRNLWCTDGTICKSKDGRCVVNFTSSSKLLTIGVKSLLLRLSIVPLFRVIKQRKGRDQYAVTLSDKRSMLTFLNVIGTVGNVSESRELLIRERLNEINEGRIRGLYRNSSADNVYWDKVKEISEHGNAKVYDITVPLNSNFICSNYIVHNSIEQDSDSVVFIHVDNEEAMMDTSIDGRVTSLIVAKNRNGPVGDVKAVFLKRYAKFGDLTNA